MEKILSERIFKLHKDFLNITEIAQSKNIELGEYKKNFTSEKSLKEKIEDFSNLAADFTLITRDSQIIFTELFNMIKLYNDLNFENLPTEIIEFYRKNEMFFPKTLFVIKEDGIVEKEEGSLQKERDKFMKSDYLKNLTNIKV